MGAGLVVSGGGGHVCQAEIPADQLALLCSDGVDADELVELLRAHDPADLQGLADAIVGVAREDDAGYRDDATLVVLSPGAEDS